MVAVLFVEKINMGCFNQKFDFMNEGDCGWEGDEWLIAEQRGYWKLMVISVEF